MYIKIIIPALLLGLLSCQKETENTELSLSATKNKLTTVLPSISATEVVIGTQVWSNSNLTASRYKNGDLIPQVTDPRLWSNLTTGAWCWYMNDSATYWQYGKLYNWFALNDPRGLAPLGWHTPSDAEWTTMVNFLGGTSVAGGKLKEAGLTHWTSPNTGATNSTGFTALPGGYRYASGSFNFLGLDGYWWTRTARNFANAWYHNLYYTDTKVYRFTSPKNYGFSIRLVKD